MWLLRTHRDLPPPVIVLGMHRSGTSLVAQMLHVGGLFIGRGARAFFEDPWFHALNESFLQRAGASWYLPGPYLEQRPDPAYHRECVELARARLGRSFSSDFLGLRRRTPLLGKPVREWGWKDPRTCLTLPVWREVFPGARLLHIVRHPLDVAISVKRREERRRERGWAPVDHSLDLGHGLRLWEVYVSEALKMRGESGRYHEVSFEELLRSPASTLGEMVRFCGLHPSEGQLASAAALVDATRTRRFEETAYAPWRESVAALPSARELGYA
jgi:hypothetical protein